MCRSIFAVTMSRARFSKWQGTGNDFILFDDRMGRFPVDDITVVRRLCDRHFGIGSDGLILLQAPRAEGSAYHMEFYNPDGSRSFCGNGSRCAYAFFGSIGGSQAPIGFTAVDGQHSASWSEGLVSIGMRDVDTLERLDASRDLIHTGSPHLICWVDDPYIIDLIPAAHVHRYGARFADAGVNVNFIRWHDGRVEMRTYERGVEAETLSCGTGVTAAALSVMERAYSDGDCAVRTPGGDLRVRAERVAPGVYRNISLSGPVAHVFDGEIEI